jgi:hypothetical protein
MSLSITSTYAGEAAAKYIAAALLSAKTLDSQAISIMPNVKYKQVIRKGAVSGLVQNASCDFSDAGAVVLTERIMQPTEKQVNLQLCKDDFQSDWDAISMGYSAHDVMPKNFQDFLIAEIAAQVAQDTETAIWTDLQALFAVSGSGVVNNGSTATLTAANVDDELAAVIDAIPNTIYDAEDLVLYVSPKIAKLYMRNLGTAGYNDVYSVGEKPLNFEGKDMIVCPGLGADEIVAAQKSNLFFGTGLMNDMNEVKIIDMADIDGSKNVRFVMRFTRGVQFGIGSEIVLNR